MRLFYGTHSPEMTPYKDILPKWEALGVQVLSVYSADGNGYVQDVFEQVSPGEKSIRRSLLLANGSVLKVGFSSPAERCHLRAVV